MLFETKVVSQAESVLRKDGASGPTHRTMADELAAATDAMRLGHDEGKRFAPATQQAVGPSGKRGRGSDADSDGDVRGDDADSDGDVRGDAAHTLAATPAKRPLGGAHGPTMTQHVTKKTKKNLRKPLALANAGGGSSVSEEGPSKKARTQAPQAAPPRMPPPTSRRGRVGKPKQKKGKKKAKATAKDDPVEDERPTLAQLALRRIAGKTTIRLVTSNIQLYDVG